MKKNFFRWALISLALLAISFAPTPIENRPTVRIDYIEDMDILILAGIPFRIDITFTNTNKLYIWPDNEYVPIEISTEGYDNELEEHTVHYDIVINEYDTRRSYQVIAENEDGIRSFAYVAFTTALPPLDAK